MAVDRQVRLGRVAGPAAMVQSFIATRGGNIRNVRIQYQGVDRRGNPIYRFSYQQPRAGGIVGRGGAPTFINVTRTLAVHTQVQGGRTRYTFGTPLGRAPGQELTHVAGRPVGLTELQQRALSAIASAYQSGRINLATAQRMSSGVRTASEGALRDVIRDFGQRPTGAAPPIIEEVGPPQEGAEGRLEDVYDFPFNFGGGLGGGGGGGFGPQYVAPDRRVVEDFVKGSLVSLIGGIPDETMVDRFTDVFMNDHRRNFDVTSREIDPSQSVIEAIRQTEQYQSIHKLRPDTEDERSWIAQRRQAAQAGGLRAGQDEFAIQQATVAASPEDTARAAGFRQIGTAGRIPSFLDQTFRRVAESMFEGVR